MKSKRSEVMLVLAWVPLILQVFVNSTMLYVFDLYTFDNQTLPPFLIHVAGPAVSFVLILLYYGYSDIPKSHIPNLLFLFLFAFLEGCWALLFAIAE